MFFSVHSSTCNIFVYPHFSLVKIDWYFMYIFSLMNKICLHEFTKISTVSLYLPNNSICFSFLREGIPVCSGTFSVEQAGLQLRDLPTPDR